MSTNIRDFAMESNLLCGLSDCNGVCYSFWAINGKNPKYPKDLINTYHNHCAEVSDDITYDMYVDIFCDGPLHQDQDYEPDDIIYHCVKCAKYQVCQKCFEVLTGYIKQE